MDEQLSHDIPADIRAVSFDVFDTLIVRSVAKPTDIFLLLETEYVAQYGLTYKGFAREREFAQWSASDLARTHTGTPEVTLDEIYAELNRKYNVTPDREIALELASCFPRKAVVDFYNACKEQGKRIFILSDMYLSRCVIEAMLHRCGVTDWDLFLLSCEEKQSKAVGGLYRVLDERIANSYGLRMSQIMHVGDNPKGDVEQARKAGMVARHIPLVVETAKSLCGGRTETPSQRPRDGRVWHSVYHWLSRAYTLMIFRDVVKAMFRIVHRVSPPRLRSYARRLLPRRFVYRLMIAIRHA